MRSARRPHSSRRLAVTRAPGCRPREACGSRGDVDVRIAIVGAGIAGLGTALAAAAARHRRDAVRGGGDARRPQPHRGRHARRHARIRSTPASSSSTRAPIRACARCSRRWGSRACRATCRSRAASTARASNGAAAICPRVFAQRRNLLRPAFHRMLADILRFNRARRRWWRPALLPPCSLGDYLDARAATARRFATGTCCRWPARSGRRRGARCSTSRCRRSRASATTTASADPRPSAMAHGAGRLAHLRRADRGDAARRARCARRCCACAATSAASRSTRAARAGRALRRRRARVPQRPGARAPRRRRVARRASRARPHPLPAQPRGAAHRRGAAAARDAACGRRGTTSRPTTRAASARSPCRTSSTSCSRCRSARR